MKIRNLFGKKELVEKEVEDLFRIESNSKNEVSKDILNSWYKIHSEGYWVGEQNGEIVAYAYFIRLNRKDVSMKKVWEEITENGSCKTHKRNGSVLFLVALGSRVLDGENYLIRGILKEIDKGFYEGIHDIYACSRVTHINPKDDLTFLDDSMVKLFKKNKFMVVSLHEEKSDEKDLKSTNILVKRKLYGASRLKLIWRRTWC